MKLLAENGMRYRESFYYWAGFLPHGYASVKLDEALLGRIYRYLEKQSRKPSACEMGTSTAKEMGARLSRQVYSEIEEQELTLSRQRCEEYGLLD